MILLLFSVSSAGQVENFEFSFPYSQDISQFSQDSAGYLWFHDTKDFYRYNGHTVQSLGLGDILGKRKYDFGMNGQIILKKDSILIFNGETLCLIHPKTRELREIWELPYGNYIEYLYQDELGHIWMFTSSWQNASRPVYSSVDGVSFTKAFDLFDNIRDRGVFWDFELDDKDGVFYLQWRLGDLLLLDKQGNELELDLADASEYNQTKVCSQFRLDNNKNLWRIHNKEFDILNTKYRRFESHPLTGHVEFITDCKKELEVTNKKLGLPGFGSLLNLRFIYEDSKSRIWLGCAASYLVYYDPELNDIFGLRSPLVKALEGGDHDIYDVLEDADGNIWGHKKGGLFKIRDKGKNFEGYVVNTIDRNHPIYAEKSNKTLNTIVDYYADYAIRNSSIHSISQDEEGDLIFQEGVFTYHLDLETKETTIAPIFSPKESLYMTYEDNLKLFSSWRAYYIINKDFTIKKAKHPILKVENSLVQKNGDIWLSGLLNKSDYFLGKLNKETLEFEGNFEPPKKEYNFLSTQVNGMDEDDDGNIWLASSDGLLQLDRKQINISTIDHTYISGSDTFAIDPVVLQVNCIGEDRLWFLTHYEICLFNIQTKKIEKYHAIDETTGGRVFYILPQGDSAVWKANEQGIEYLNFNTGSNFLTSKEDGIDARGAVRILYQVDNGDIAAGTNNGLYMFNPDSLLNSNLIKSKSEQFVELKINSFNLVNGSVDTLIRNEFLVESDLSIELAYNDKMLELEYSLLNFNSPERHLYSYQLEGYDDVWSKPSNSNVASFTSLPPGNYTFNLKGAIGSGQWSNQTLSIPIHVKQAWFRTWWFISLLLGSLGMLIYWLTSYYFKQKLERQLAIEKLRNKISSDLHDDVGSVLAGISMQSEILSLKSGDSDKKELVEISVMSRDAMDKMRDIVWAMNSNRDKYENLIDRMIDFAEKQFSRSSLDFTFDVIEIEGSQTLNPDLRQNLYFIFKESITNAIKHSNGTFVKIALSNNNGLFKLSVKDNGTGFNSRSQTGGLGLNNIKMRADLINGQLSILTNDGYEVCVEVDNSMIKA